MISKNTLQTSILSIPTITYTIILPQSCKRTILWLHGYKERSEQLLARPIFEQMAEQYHTAIVFPDVPNTYYINQQWNNCHTEDFLIKDFIPHVVKQHHLPVGHDSLLIAGISMGGFGGLLLGAHYPEIFGKIACISGAFIIDDLTIGNPEVVGSTANIFHFQNIFGDIPSLANDKTRNPLCAIESLENQQQLPPIFIACGTEDLLYRRNTKLYRCLQAFHLDVTWYEAPGDHDWNFFHQAISRAFIWMFD